MATIQGLTKERMLEIEGASVVSGHVDGGGDLILVTHDGTEFNAGHVQAPNLADATTATKGIIEIATNAEVEAASDLTRAMTPGRLPLIATTFSGVVVSTYSGTDRNVRVTLDAGQMVSGTQNAICNVGDLDMKPGVAVSLVRIGGPGGLWFVTQAFPAMSAYLKPIRIPLQNGWALYNDTTDYTEEYGAPRYFLGGYTQAGLVSSAAGYIYATMSRYGIVRLEGLLFKPASTGVPVSGSIIAQLPIGMAPTYEQAFMNICGTGTGSIVITPDGAIRYHGGVVTGYFSVSDVMFRAKSAVDLGLATFTSLIPYITGFAASTLTYYSGGPTSHPPGYTLDADGVAIFEGAIVSTAAYTLSSVFGRLTALGYNYPRAAHIPVWVVGYGVNLMRFGTQTGASLTGTQGMNFGMAMASGTTVILSQVSLIDPVLKTPIAQGLNGWVTYDANWREPCVSVTPDRQVFFGGLWSTGTLGLPMMKMSNRYGAHYTQIKLVISNLASARTDLKKTGDVIPNTGSAVWYSLDSLSHAPFYLSEV